MYNMIFLSIAENNSIFIFIFITSVSIANTSIQNIA